MTLGHYQRFRSRLRTLSDNRLIDWTGRLFRRLARKSNSARIGLVTLAMQEAHRRWEGWHGLFTKD